MSVRTVRGGLLALLLPLTACVSGPDYHLPANAVAASQRAARAFVSGQDPSLSHDVPPDRWWHLYGDPQLDAYVREALAANTDLRAADANLRRASATVLEYRARGAAQADVDASGTLTHAGGYTQASAAPQSYALGLHLSYPLDLAGGIRRGIEAANADAAAVAAARDQVRVVVAAAVTRAYLQVCTRNHTLAATRQVLAVQRATLDATRRLAAGGRGTDFDVSRAGAAINRSAAAVPHLLAERQAALFELAALMGRVPADYPREAEACPQPPELEQALSVGDGWQLLQRRPDIRAAERSLAAATAMIGVETADLYPRVTLGGSLGTAGTRRQLLSADGFGVSVGPLLSWHWPNRRVAKARIAAAGANAEATLASFDGVVLQALRQTETALSACTQELERERSLAQARGDAERAAGQAQQLYRYGRIDFLDVLSAQAALADAESALAASRAERVDRQMDVFLSLGGGWAAGAIAVGAAR
ncbi:NodT family efflux transporter outer membrane factor (OMF) lipoprotein [Stenotrophomonas sp. PvP093]|uniref:efflux transporter outer membrane subunit n=1 Tax=Stenotrophomonas TaxID=40323 RepID=UPI0007B1A816|nr:RND transporter [Stenotrophomonas maltophilia]MBP2482093.1 NodT family efflux transporter outer membrane factor (OMF) lipoprotein [Stenotrophomonas sp. PvP093]MCF3545993.1 efflux transporter outer membrane subunit [Stenotrophomonas maltophilia]TNY01749.1 efflux transporter outer membrane subunit [Stenotrophomonas maltophilia]TPD79891.1 efflux transporter outer membrane subunit [Stenotrophomonas maltophilia]